MATKKPAKKAPQKSGRASKGFTQEEREAMRERASELRATRSKAGAASEENAVIAKIASMPAKDRAMGERLHSIIRFSAPELTPKLWYGMPAYAKDGKVVCFFQNAQKFKTRYSTLGFSDKAALDEGQMWATAFALKELTDDDEERIATLVKKAVT